MSQPETQLTPESVAIAESMSEGFVSLTPNLRVNYINKSAISLLGAATRWPAIGEYLWDVYAPESIAAGEQTCRLVMESGSPMTFTVDREESELWYVVTVAPAGRGLVFYFTDTSDNRKRDKIEALLRAERQLMYDLFMQAPALIAVLRGPEHVFQLANEPYVNAIGPNRPILGLPIRAALPELEGQGIFELLDGVYATGKPHTGNEVKLKLAKSGTEELVDAYFTFVYQPFRNPDGCIQGILVHAADVTQHIQDRHAAQKLQEQWQREHDKLLSLEQTMEELLRQSLSQN